MGHKAILLFALLAAGHWGCGNAAGHETPEIKGPTVTSTTAQGMLLATVNVDSSLTNSRVYHYDFADGVVRELISGESGNPAVFAVGAKVLFFNRQADQVKTLRVYDPAAEAGFTDALVLEDLGDGDPLDVAPLSQSQALLASGLGGKLQVLDYAKGLLTDVSASNLASTDLRPMAVKVIGSTAFIAHTGIADLASGAGQVDGSQQLYVASVSSSNPASVSFVDQTSGGAIDGLALTASNPFAIINQNDKAATLVGLCSDNIPNCIAGADRLDNGAVTKLRQFGDDFEYAFLNTITDGPDSTTVYAHVRSKDDRYLVIKLNVATGESVTIHEFADERLYSLSYEKTSQTLFVGGTDGLQGIMTLYQNDQSAGAFQLDGAPYHAAFIAK